MIIGAGAAGLAATHLLRNHGILAPVLEARGRIGGRVWTDESFAAHPVELGAEFIHGENAVTHELVRAAGLTVTPVDRYDRGLRWALRGGRALPRSHMPPEMRALIERLFGAYAALADASLPTDLSLADYLRRAGFNTDALAIADVLLAQTCCARLDDLSCADLAREMRTDQAGKREARINEGYAALFRWYADGLDVRLNMPVTAVHWSADGVTVMTHGSKIHARRCIVTVPVSLLQRDMPSFDPPLPADKQAAIQAFRTEPATKLIYRFKARLWDDDLTFMAHDGTVARWWSPVRSEVMCAFVTADRARIIDALPEAEALLLGLREMAALLGAELADLEHGLTAARRIAWAHDPLALGGYAHLPPSAAEARPTLGMPVGSVLFFAGEATAYDSNPQTVHGALESGWRAARECLETLS